MAWIRTIDESDADGKLAELYARLATPSGSVDHILKIHSLLPQGLEDHYALYRNLMTAREGIGRRRREMIAVVTSKANDCHY